ncbi:putative flippase GtrA [Rhodoblastus acidophilus]|nr:GtrA family protein [Rhodoblastus acidophilus]MCW2274709.1 putative flippase GtrA [Rhodoblastus acidophilus]
MTPARTAKEKAIGLIRRLAQVRVLRFLVVGGLNTAFGYGLYYALLRLSGSAMFALTLGTVLNVLFNFMTTGALVFRRMEGHRLVRYLGVYVLVYLYNAAGLILLLAVKVDPALAGLLLLPGAVVLSYLLNRSFVFNARPGAGHEKTHA